MVTVMENVVKFRFFCPDAKEVQIIGDFTGWRSGQIHMTKDAGGFWNAEVPLPEGIFHFRYLADGQWHTDEAVCDVDDGPFGVDSVLWVLPRRLTQTQQCQAKKRLLRAADARIGLPAPQTHHRGHHAPDRAARPASLARPSRETACCSSHWE